MKKCFLFLLIVFSSVVKAENIDLVFKQYVIQNNNLDKCLFPEIYQANDENEILNHWWEDDANNGRMRKAYYLKLKMRLAQKIMDTELANQFIFGELSAITEKSYKHAREKYHKQTSVQLSQCEKVGVYATNLIEEYDTFDDKWRKNFPEP